MAPLPTRANDETALTPLKRLTEAVPVHQRGLPCAQGILEMGMSFSDWLNVDNPCIRALYCGSLYIVRCLGGDCLLQQLKKGSYEWIASGGRGVALKRDQ